MPLHKTPKSSMRAGRQRGSRLVQLVAPAKKKATTGERAAAIGRIQKLGRRLSLGGMKIKELIAEGRK